MPTYIYDCPRCGEFELVQKITEDALKMCPNLVQTNKGKQTVCSAPIKRLIAGSVSVSWKGSAPTPKHYI